MMIVVVFFLHIYFSFTKPLYGFCCLLVVKILIPDNVRFPAGDLSLNTVCTALSQLLDNGGECAVRSFTNLRKNFGEFSSEQGARVTATYLTFVETCKLMAKAPLDFFRRFFDMIVAGRRDYALMKEAFLVKPVEKQKTPIS